MELIFYSKKKVGNVMIQIREGKVAEVIHRSPELEELMVIVEGKEARALNYPALTGKANKGDRVILNTTAVSLKLGTGGNHFVIINLEHPCLDTKQGGHIMKLRYTPYQVKCWSAEEEDMYGQQIESFSSLEKMPVIAGSLHSQLPAAAAGIKAVASNVKLAYIMTDGAALPIAFSKLVRILKQKGLLDATITVGHAFGGDYEAVNIYSGLIVAKEVVKADAVVVCMGPGIVGTGTRYGFTGVEQAEIIHAAYSLGGTPIAIPRLSFADLRERHYGVSHHTLTVLSKLTLVPAVVVLPELLPDKKNFILKKFQETGIDKLHEIHILSGEKALSLLKDHEVKVTTMGRSIEEEREFFLAAGACGHYAAQLIKAN